MKKALAVCKVWNGFELWNSSSHPKSITSHLTWTPAVVPQSSARARCLHSPAVFISDASRALEGIVALKLVRVFQWLDETSMAGTDCQILIIGCGISGVTAAKTLIDAGFQKVRILEATDRSGGRLLTGTLGERQVSQSGGNAFVKKHFQQNTNT